MSNRKIFDAHVHIMPEHLLGKVDPLGIEWSEFGEWIFDGEMVVHRMPPYFEKSCFSADALIATMNFYGIEKAAIMQSYMFEINEDIAEAIKKYPDRLIGAMTIDPREEDVTEQIRNWKNRGVTILKFEMKGYTHPKAYPDMKFNSPDMKKVLDTAEELGMTVTIDTSNVGGSGYQVEELDQAISSHPALRFVICHFGFAEAALLKDETKYNRWKEMCALARYSNVWIDISAMPDLFIEDGYPFKNALKLFEEFVKDYGSKKAIWGSDIPGTFNSATYKEMIDMYEKDENLSDECKKNLFYYNAVDAYL